METLERCCWWRHRIFSSFNNNQMKYARCRNLLYFYPHFLPSPVRSHILNHKIVYYISVYIYIYIRYCRDDIVCTPFFVYARVRSQTPSRSSVLWVYRINVHKWLDNVIFLHSRSSNLKIHLLQRLCKLWISMRYRKKEAEPFVHKCLDSTAVFKKRRKKCCPSSQCSIQ